MVDKLTKPKSHLELIDWCIRKLGGDNLFGPPVGGVIDVIITKQQALDRLSEAVTLFNQSHFSGYRETGLILNTTKDKTNYKLPDNIIDVLWYIPVDDKHSIFALDYQIKQALVMGGLQNFDLVTIELVYEYLKMLNLMIGEKTNFTFNQLTHELDLLVNPTTDKLVLACYMLIDVEEYPDIWNDIWLRDMVFNLIKRQFAENLKVFGNVNMAGGVTLNVDAMYQEANDEIIKLKEELETKWSFPPKFFIG